MNPFVTRVMLPAAAVSAVCVVVGTAIAGRDGAYGALIGAVLVAVFFLSSLAVLGPTKKIAPTITMMIALTFYVTKIVALVAVFVVLFGPGGIGENVHRESLAATVVACTLAWTVLEIRFATKARIPLYDLTETDR